LGQELTMDALRELAKQPAPSVGTPIIQDR
jgi:hypothetical protein